MRIMLLVFAFSCSCMSGAYAANSCLQYSPASAALTGKLKRLTFPGRPNFESVVSGDEAETGFYLALKKEVCVDGDKDSADSYPQRKVNLVQLVLDNDGYAQLRPLLGGEVVLNGALFARHTAHHHAPLLLKDVVLGSENKAK